MIARDTITPSRLRYLARLWNEAAEMYACSHRPRAACQALGYAREYEERLECHSPGWIPAPPPSTQVIR